MHIVAIAWLYVAALMAAGEPGLFRGLLTFTLWGALPVALLLWLGGGRARRLAREKTAPRPVRLLADQGAGQGDGADAQADQ